MSVDQRKIKKLRRKRKGLGVLQGKEGKPRLCVFRSLRYTYAQLVEDSSGRVLASASTREIEGLDSKSSVAGAEQLGKRIAELAQEKKIESVIFDRNGYKYHGRVSAVAEGARQAGLRI